MKFHPLYISVAVQAAIAVIALITWSQTKNTWAFNAACACAFAAGITLLLADSQSRHRDTKAQFSAYIQRIDEHTEKTTKRLEEVIALAEKLGVLKKERP